VRRLNNNLETVVHEPPKEMQRTSVNIPKPLEQQLIEAVIGDGYGMRGKNKWLCEKLDRFLDFKPDDYVDLIETTRALDVDLKTTTLLTIRYPIEYEERIEKMIFEVRRVYPGLESLKSNIIRTSIIQGILRR
jgi:hypothetical protein